MHWEADVRIAGPVGSMGQRVLQPIVNQQVKNVLAALERKVQEAVASAPRPDAETPAGSGSDPPAVEGASGAEQGISPWHEEAYSEDPDGPTRSTRDAGA